MGKRERAKGGQLDVFDPVGDCGVLPGNRPLSIGFLSIASLFFFFAGSAAPQARRLTTPSR